MRTAAWKDQLHHLYKFHYQGRGGMLALSIDLGVCRTTVQNWYHEKINKSTGRVIEPTYENRLAIAELWNERKCIIPGGK